MKKYALFIAAILLLSQSVTGTIVNLYGAFSQGAPIVPDSIRIKVFGSYGDSIDTRLFTSGYTDELRDTLNRDYSAQTALSLIWVVYYGGDSSKAAEDVSHCLYNTGWNTEIAKIDGILDTTLILQDSAESYDDWVGNMRYSYTDSILALRGLHIRGTTGNDTGLIAHGYGTGNGVSFYGGASNATGFVIRGQGTGAGMYVLGGSNGDALRMLGGIGCHGFKSTGGSSGDAIYLQAGSGGYDVELCGSGTITTGAANVFMTTDSALVANRGEIAGQFADSVLEDTVHYQGTASLDAPEIADTLFARLVSDTVNNSYLAQLIRDLKATRDSLESQDDWVGNTRYSYTDSILRLRGISVKGTTGNDTAVQLHGYGSGPGFYSRGGATNAHGIYAIGQGSGTAFYLSGGSSNGYGIYAVGQGTASGCYFGGGTGGGHGLYAVGGGAGFGGYYKGGTTNGRGLYILGVGSGVAALFEGGATNAHGISAVAGGSGKDIYLGTSGGISDGTNTALMTDDSVLTANLDEIAARIADSIWGHLLSEYSSAPGSAGDVLYDSIDALVSSAGGVASISDADMAAIADTLYNRNDSVFSDSFWNWVDFKSDTVTYTYGGGFGYGPRTITHYVVDTQGTDTALANVPIHVVYLSGNRHSEPTTNSSGYVTLKCSDNDTLVYFVETEPWHVFTLDTTGVTTSDVTDSSFGYDAEIATPGGDSTAVVYCYLYDYIANAKEGGKLQARLSGKNIEDTCNDVIIIPFEKSGSASDTTGRCEITLKKSKCLVNREGNHPEYVISLIYNSVTVYTWQDTIPDSTTYRLTRH